MLFISIYITSQVYWSDTGELVCIATEDEVYMLRYNPEKAEGTPDDEDGFEDAFEVLGEVSDKIMTGWLAMETNFHSFKLDSVHLKSIVESSTTCSIDV